MALVKPCAAASLHFEPTGSLNVARTGHTATLLLDGQVLPVGGATGSTGTALASAELYDPTSGTWTLSGSLFTGRILHTATLLPNGKVLTYFICFRSSDLREKHSADSRGSAAHFVGLGLERQVCR